MDLHMRIGTHGRWTQSACVPDGSFCAEAHAARADEETQKKTKTKTKKVQTEKQVYVLTPSLSRVGAR